MPFVCQIRELESGKLWHQGPQHKLLYRKPVQHVLEGHYGGERLHPVNIVTVVLGMTGNLY